MKLNKMEVQALAETIILQIKEAKLPELLTAWELKEAEIRETPAYKTYEAWHNMYAQDSFKSKVTTLEQLKRYLGLAYKPTLSIVQAPSVNLVINKIILGQINSPDINTLVEGIKNEFLTVN